MRRLLVLLGALAIWSGVLPAHFSIAAPAGQAYDDVIKFAMSGDADSMEPGDFNADYEVAAKPPDQHRGLFSGIQNAIGSVSAMMKNGMAERHYIVAGTLERSDTPSQQVATIVDCRNRTRTHLDLAKKTYYVESLDATPAARATAAPMSRGPMPTWTDDGSRYKITVDNHALGAKTVSGESTNGYSSNITMVATKANGDSSTSQMKLHEYLSDHSEVTGGCAARAYGGTPAAGGLAELAFVKSALLSTSSRFTVSSSGPKLPSTMALFMAMTMSGSGSGRSSGGSFTIVVERGNVRSIGASDPVFSVPPDFTKVEAPASGA